MEQAEELFEKVAGFASFGFNKSHAAAFARTAYESSFLKLFYPAQFVTGLINAQPMGFYPVEVLINDAKRHGVAVLPVDVNRSRYRSTTEWAGMPGTPLPEGAGIDRRPAVVRSTSVVVPDRAARDRYAAPTARGYGIRLGLHLVKGIGEAEGEALDAELARGGPYRSLADLVARTELPRRSSSGSSGPARSTRWAGRAGSCSGSCGRWPPPPGVGRMVVRSARRRRRAGRSIFACRRPRPPISRHRRSSSASATATRSSRSTPGTRWSSSSAPRSIGWAPCRWLGWTIDRRATWRSAGWWSRGSTR